MPGVAETMCYRRLWHSMLESNQKRGDELNYGSGKFSCKYLGICVFFLCDIPKEISDVFLEKNRLCHWNSIDLYMWDYWRMESMAVFSVRIFHFGADVFAF